MVDLYNIRFGFILNFSGVEVDIFKFRVGDKSEYDIDLLRI